MNKAELLERCKDLGVENYSEDLTNKELKALIKAKEAEIAEQEEASEETEVENETETEEKEEEAATETSEETEEDEEETSAKEKVAASVFEDERGLKWEFKKSAPKTINIDGKPMTQEEILQTKDVMAELVYGNSNFLIQKH